MKNVRSISCIILALAMVFAMAACGDQPDPAGSADPSGSAEPVVLRLATQHADTNSTTVAMQTLADQVYEKTEGRVIIEIYGNNTLGAASEALTMLDTGVCDLVWTSSAFFAGQFPYSEALELPMMGIVDGVEGTEIYWDLMETYPEQFTEFDDYYMWTAYTAPATIVGVATKMVENADDLKGLNIRAAAGANASIVSAWGAAPVSIAPSDLYMSIQKGVADGFLFNASTLDSWKLGELTKHVVNIGLGYSQIFILGSKDAISKLSAEDQAILNEVGGRVGSIYLAEKTEEEANIAIENFTAIGGTYSVYTEGDTLYDALKAPLSSIVEDWVSRVSTDSFDATQIVNFIAEKAGTYAN